MELRKKIIRLAGALTLLVFAGYYCGITLFPHTHVIAGQIITHSHPYNGTDHQHSSEQVVHLSHLGLLAFFAVATALAALVCRPGSAIVSSVINSHSSQRTGCICKRGPPVK